MQGVSDSRYLPAQDPSSPRRVPTKDEGIEILEPDGRPESAHIQGLRWLPRGRAWCDAFASPIRFLGSGVARVASMYSQAASSIFAVARVLCCKAH